MSRSFSSRRRFLATTLGSALATGLLPSPARAATETEVLVIGAGAAGLAAARKLVEWDYDVILLEGAQRIGGRVWTDWSLGLPFEVGAGWIHGPEGGNPVSALARAVGARTFVTDDESFLVFAADGSPVERAKIEASYRELEAIYRRIDDTLERDTSLVQAIRRVSPGFARDPILNWMASAYTEFDTGGPIEQLSAYNFDEDEAYPGDDVVLPGGYEALLAPLADGLDIRLGHPVERIAYGDGVRVRAKGQDFRADQVICTCPLGVLKGGSIAFDPPLPRSYRQRIERIAMGNVTKIGLKFAEPHWPLETQYFGLMTEEKGRWNYFLNARTFSDQNVLVGLSVGAYAGKVERLSDEQMTADALEAVRRMFGEGVPAPLEVITTRWSRNPFSLGAYSFSNQGVRPRDFDSLASPIEETLLLAGEHTTFDYHGTVHGALLSGEQAAEILDEELA